jgi:hypothetical protein
MPKHADPRQFAELCRRLASIPTSGGHNIDRVLHTLASKAEYEAALAQPPAAESPKTPRASRRTAR